ncbi:hypothetical protein CCGE525_36630 (plasmid) [Rhizobium jaguaris]|uniref:Uncharacterized protein n=1 Tax=Rhizobium jaguaris TaxID=1312183 RepID=A0A387G4G6_9HYPH|nr:hypothetical protein CCGE525_36630 [Rhizobium jaguaris]
MPPQQLFPSGGLLTFTLHGPRFPLAHFLFRSLTLFQRRLRRRDARRPASALSRPLSAAAATSDRETD